MTRTISALAALLVSVPVCVGDATPSAVCSISVLKCVKPEERETCVELSRNVYDATPFTDGNKSWGKTVEQVAHGLVERLEKLAENHGGKWESSRRLPALTPRFVLTNERVTHSFDYSRVEKEGVDPEHPHLLVVSETVMNDTGKEYEFPPTPEALFYADLDTHFCAKAPSATASGKAEECYLAKTERFTAVENENYNRDQPPEFGPDRTLDRWLKHRTVLAAQRFGVGASVKEATEATEDKMASDNFRDFRIYPLTDSRHGELRFDHPAYAEALVTTTVGAGHPLSFTPEHTPPAHILLQLTLTPHTTRTVVRRALPAAVDAQSEPPVEGSAKGAEGGPGNLLFSATAALLLAGALVLQARP